MNSSVAIQVTFDASFMRGGIYESEIMVYSNDPDDPVVGVEVSLEVIDAPSVQTLVEEIDFGQVFIGYPVTRYLEVTNNGSQDLLVTEMVAEPGVFSTTPPYLSIDPGETETISVQFSPLNSIPYSGSLTLVNNDPLQEEYVIDLAGEGLVAPVIGISTTMLDVSLEPGDTEQRSVSVMNSGGSGLQYSITPSSNQCLSFDGVGNYIQVPAFSPVQNVSMSDFTFETWVFFNDFEASDQYLFSASSSYYYYPIEVRTTSDQRIRFFIYDNYGNYREVYSSVLDPDTWYHIACVYDGDAQKIFINGQEEATYNWYGHFTITSGFTVGKHYNYSSGYLDGILDETRIWQVSKTAAGIQQDMYREIPTATPGLISCWTYDNIEGNTVVDQSGFYNDGAISGEVQFADLQSPLHEWLSVSPGSGNCPPNGNINSTVVFDATGMAIGDYYRTMRIASNDPEFPVVTIPVHMLVGYGVGTGGNEEGGLTSVFCYPNPFSGSVKIRYFLAEEGKVTLVVFDQLGQKVAVLCDEAQTAGSHEVTWNAEGLPGGVYFYRLSTGHQVSATGGKLILLR
jgi:hypothetical protein